ncbi:hypothetical protein HFP71_16900 [Streptomyces sp. ARC32]
MHLADTYKQTITHSLVGFAQKGTITLPQAMLDDHDHLMTLFAEGQQYRKQWSDPAKEGEAEKVAKKLRALRHYGGHDGLIRERIRPALEDFLTRFQNARREAGKSGREANLHPSMLLEPEPVRVAIAELHDTTAQYSYIHHAWALLRGGGAHRHDTGTLTDIDPQGSRSILGEIRNIADIFPEWVNAGTIGGTPWPWTGQPAHLRLAWVLDNGGELWAPTAAEHNQLYVLLRKEGRASAGPMRQEASALGIG